MSSVTLFINKEKQMKLIEVSNASVSYGALKAASNVSFDLNKEEYLCIAGANGSGKSTILKAIMKLIPLSEGSIDVKIPYEKISYLAQVNAAERDFPATVREIVIMGTQRKANGLPFYSREDKEKAIRAMDLLGITKIADKRIGNLSGGQQQRVLLARAFCRNPEVLLLDEPCCGLDPEIAEELYNLCKKLHQEHKISIIMASHDFDAIEKYADRVIVMSNTVEFDGSVAQWCEAFHKPENHIH